MDHVGTREPGRSPELLFIYAAPSSERPGCRLYYTRPQRRPERPTAGPESSCRDLLRPRLQRLRKAARTSSEAHLKSPPALPSLRDPVRDTMSRGHGEEGELVAWVRYTTTKETGKRWGVSMEWVSSLCRQGRVEGAGKVGWIWIVPIDAEKPEDLRVWNGRWKKHRRRRRS